MDEANNDSYEEPVDTDLDLDEEDEEDIKDLIFQLEKQDDDDNDNEEEDDEYYELPKATYWVNPDTYKIVDGVEVRPPKRKKGERDDLDLCSICLTPWTTEKVHRMSCLPCGHVYGLSCLRDIKEDYFFYKCPQCYKLFLLKDVRLLYATRLCIPDDQEESIRRFPYNKQGFTAFKQYQRELLTNALNNRSHALKQRADVLALQKDAMKQRTKLLNRMANTQKRAEALACLGGAEKRAEASRCRANALGQQADECLRKADAFGQRVKALRQQSKASRQQVGAYMASIKFYKQSYKELLGLRGIRSQMDKEEDHKPLEANKEYKQEQEQQEHEQHEQEQQEQENMDLDLEEDDDDDDDDDDDEDDDDDDADADADADDDDDDDDGDEYDDDDDDYDYDDDDEDEVEDEVDDKETSLLPKATSWIDVYSGKTVDRVDVPLNKRKRDEEEETVDGVEVPSNKRKRDEEEEHVELELDLDENDDDFEQVEEMTLPLVISRIDNGKTVHEIEVPVMKDDEFIDDSMYRDDYEPTDSKKDFAEALDFRPPQIQANAPDVCPICFKHWTGDEEHRACCLPCGHIFGASCIKKWLQTDIRSTRCPECMKLCLLESVRPLSPTYFRIPGADIGAENQKTPTRRFSLCNLGMIAFHKLETARRNFALKKWCEAKKRLDGVLSRKKKAMKRRTDLLDRMKALEQQGGSLSQADALGSLADEYLRRAKACEGRAKALRQRAKAYNQRVNACQPRLDYFAKCRDDIPKLG